MKKLYPTNDENNTLIPVNCGKVTQDDIACLQEQITANACDIDTLDGALQQKIADDAQEINTDSIIADVGNIGNLGTNNLTVGNCLTTEDIKVNGTLTAPNGNISNINTSALRACCITASNCICTPMAKATTVCATTVNATTGNVTNLNASCEINTKDLSVTGTLNAPNMAVDHLCGNCDVQAPIVKGTRCIVSCGKICAACDIFGGNVQVCNVVKAGNSVETPTVNFRKSVISMSQAVKFTATAAGIYYIRIRTNLVSRYIIWDRTNTTNNVTVDDGLTAYLKDDTLYVVFDSSATHAITHGSIGTDAATLSELAVETVDVPDEQYRIKTNAVNISDNAYIKCLETYDLRSECGCIDGFETNTLRVNCAIISPNINAQNNSIVTTGNLDHTGEYSLVNSHGATVKTCDGQVCINCLCTDCIDFACGTASCCFTICGDQVVTCNLVVCNDLVVCGATTISGISADSVTTKEATCYGHDFFIPIACNNTELPHSNPVETTPQLKYHFAGDYSELDVCGKICATGEICGGSIYGSSLHSSGSASVATEVSARTMRATCGFTGNLTGTATKACCVIPKSVTCNSDVPVPIYSCLSASPTQQLGYSGCCSLTFKPTTGALTATYFCGTVIGNISGNITPNSVKVVSNNRYTCMTNSDLSIYDCTGCKVAIMCRSNDSGCLILSCNGTNNITLNGTSGCATFNCRVDAKGVGITGGASITLNDVCGCTMQYLGTSAYDNDSCAYLDLYCKCNDTCTKGICINGKGTICAAGNITSCGNLIAECGTICGCCGCFYGPVASSACYLVYNGAGWTTGKFGNSGSGSSSYGVLSLNNCLGTEKLHLYGDSGEICTAGNINACGTINTDNYIRVNKNKSLIISSCNGAVGCYGVSICDDCSSICSACIELYCRCGSTVTRGINILGCGCICAKCGITGNTVVGNASIGICGNAAFICKGASYNFFRALNPSNSCEGVMLGAGCIEGGCARFNTTNGTATIQILGCSGNIVACNFTTRTAMALQGWTTCDVATAISHLNNFAMPLATRKNVELLCTGCWYQIWRGGARNIGQSLTLRLTTNYSRSLNASHLIDISYGWQGVTVTDLAKDPGALLDCIRFVCGPNDNANNQYILVHVRNSQGNNALGVKVEGSVSNICSNSFNIPIIVDATCTEYACYYEYALGTSGLLVNGSVVDPIPVGTVQMYMGTSLPNDNWLWADGKCYLRTCYPALATVLGNKYGGNSTCFYVPNFTNRFPQGTCSTSACDACFKTISAGLPALCGCFEIAGGILGSEGIGGWNTAGAFCSENFTVGQGATATCAMTVPGAPVDSAGRTRTIFNAARCSSIYGNSTTVQPDAVTVNYIIKAR